MTFCSLMQAALDVTVPYVHERKQFGVPIGEFQVRDYRNFCNSTKKKYLRLNNFF